VLNLFIEGAADCSSAKQDTLRALRSAFARAGGQQLEIAAQDLSPGCRERGQMALDVNAIGAAFSAAQQALPAAHVRPVIVYVDDIDLPVPSGTLAGMFSARATLPQLRPVVWSVSFASVAAQLAADQNAAWTYAGDPELAKRVGALVDSQLPFRSTATPTSGPVALLDAAELDVTREFKLCAASPQAMAGTYPEPGATQRLDRAHPPTIVFVIPQSIAVPKSSYANVTVEASVEGCTGNCERYFIREPGADPLRWDEMRRCALGNR